MCVAREDREYNEMKTARNKRTKERRRFGWGKERKELEDKKKKKKTKEEK